MTTQLDHFETALLTELRTVVAERQPPRRSRRRFVRAGLAAAAVAGLAVLVVPGIGNQPAYAVTTDGDGDVHVRVHELSDAAGLERALAAQGVTADVTYLPDGMECAPGRYRQAPDVGGDFRFAVGNGYGYSVDLDAGVIRDGETLVIDASSLGDGGSHAEIGVATGAVAPCDPVAVPPGPPGS